MELQTAPRIKTHKKIRTVGTFLAGMGLFFTMAYFIALSFILSLFTDPVSYFWVLYTASFGWVFVVLGIFISSIGGIMIWVDKGSFKGHNKQE
jgi:drug/metabolite transporter (DMT)-like permease